MRAVAEELANSCCSGLGSRLGCVQHQVVLPLVHRIGCLLPCDATCTIGPNALPILEDMQRGKHSDDVGGSPAQQPQARLQLLLVTQHQIQDDVEVGLCNTSQCRTQVLTVQFVG